MCINTDNYLIEVRNWEKTIVCSFKDICIHKLLTKKKKKMYIKLECFYTNKLKLNTLQIEQKKFTFKGLKYSTSPLEINKTAI